MRKRFGLPLLVAVLAVLVSSEGVGAQVRELQGAWLIDGYSFEPGDRSPRGTVAYDGKANTFTGTYVGLKLPGDRPQLHAWLYDTRSKKALHLGRVDYKPDTIGKNKAAFSLAAPPQVKGGRFRPYELIAFSAEADGARPTYPSGSAIQPLQRPAFYLYAALPGSDIPGVYCGHGQDFSYTSNDDHTCFD